MPPPPTRALSIRQPYAELILRGLKTIEYRSRPTKVVGVPFLIYASKKPVKLRTPALPKAWSDELEVPSVADAPPRAVVELVQRMRLDAPLPTGVIVGTATIARVTLGDDGLWCWHLADVTRAKELRAPVGHPQPVWFNAF